MGASDSLIGITLLVELGVAAAVASSLARSVTFKRLLLEQHRSLSDSLRLIAMVCVPLMLGVWIRVHPVPNFLAADLSFEATILLALLMGPLAAIAGASLLAVPALLHHEYLALPGNIVIAVIFSAAGRFLRSDEIWSFSPLIDLSVYRWVRGKVKYPHLDNQMLLLGLIMAVQFGSSMLAHFYPHLYFDLYSHTWWVELAICATPPVVVGIPLKIWNAIRLDRKLEEQARLLTEARFDALQRQINPHFLFNTLNSIASLIRSKPELARTMIVKLANILRVLLKDREAFVPFSDELAFTDDYLDIEVVRFGEKLRVVKEIAEDTLDVVVPSMLLQPLIENSIKHGISSKIDGGTVTIRTALSNGRLSVEVEDDGVGIPEVELAGILNKGIGVSNVKERLKVLYNQDYRMLIDSQPGRGTRIEIEVPGAQTRLAAVS